MLFKVIWVEGYEKENEKVVTVTFFSSLEAVNLTSPNAYSGETIYHFTKFVIDNILWDKEYQKNPENKSIDSKKQAGILWQLLYTILFHT